MGYPAALSASCKILLCVLLVYAASALAPPSARADESPTLTGDAAHGAQLVTNCVPCHGRGGEGVANDGFPRLAGQYATYLTEQMHDFVAHTRIRPVMSYYVKTTSAQDLADLGAYYASLNTPPAQITAAASPAEERGRVLVQQGDASIGVAACSSCHGADSRGRPPEMPYLAGQNAEYISEQLQAWQSGDRRSERGQQMAAVAKRLSAGDITAVAAWLARQAPPLHQ
jgi:cytochrome c553